MPCCVGVRAVMVAMMGAVMGAVELIFRRCQASEFDRLAATCGDIAQHVSDVGLVGQH